MRRLFRAGLPAAGVLSLSILAGLAGLAVGSFAPLACSSFGETDSASDTSDSASTTDSSSPANADASSDAQSDGGGVEEEPAALRPLCPPPRGPSGSLLSSKVKVLYEPPASPRFPFGITTDAKYVYWAEQDNSADGYNGNSKARILRVPKAGGDAVEMASDQPSVSALALDGEYVYWATYVAGSAGSTAAIARARRACIPGTCNVEPFAALAAGVRVTELLSAGPGMLVARLSSPGLARIDTSQRTATPVSLTETASGLAALGAAFYVTRSGGQVITEYPPDFKGYTEFSPTTSSEGYVGLTADCTTLWCTRSSSIIGINGPERKVTKAFSHTLADVFDTAADAAFVYLARANAGGVAAIDKSSGAVLSIWDGNVFALDVDDEGIYWGDHAPSTGGSLYMLVK